MANSKNKFTIKRAAKELGVHPHTIKNWIKTGKLERNNIRIPRDYNGWLIFTQETIQSLRQWKESVKYNASYAEIKGRSADETSL